MTRLNLRLFAMVLLLMPPQLGASVLAGLPQTEPWRKLPPKAPAPRPFALPATRETSLENGLTIVFIEDHRAPIVTIQIGIPLAPPSSTNLAEMTNHLALAEATAELITEGAGARTSEQVAREVETLGGRLSSSMNDDYAEVAATVVAENAERMMDLLGDVLLKPAFPESEVTLYKRNRIQTVTVDRQDPAFLTEEQFNRTVFGVHPYAISAPTAASIEALDREKLAQYYRSNFGPQGSVAIFAGDFNAGRMDAKAREILGQWKSLPKQSANRTALALPARSAKRIYVVNRPGSEQVDFRIGGLAVKRSDPDFFQLLVANAILGAGTSSRLFLNIREQKGYAYDVYSSVNALREAGTFFGGAQTRTEATGRAIRDIIAEFDRLARVRVGTEELRSAKNFLNGLFSLSLSTQGGVAERIMQAHIFGLGPDYLDTYRARIEAVTAEQVQEAARKYIAHANQAIVVVGDAGKLRRILRPIAPFEVIEIDGKRSMRSQ